LSKKAQKVQRNRKKRQKVHAFYKKITKNDKKCAFFTKKSQKMTKNPRFSAANAPRIYHFPPNRKLNLCTSALTARALE
jgi:hypothetical protein